jgi:uncharacterized protein YjbI with pentapeptide repeats
MLSDSLNAEVWERLRQSKPLEGISLATKDGRADLCGLSLPDPSVLQRWQTPTANMSQILPAGEFRGIRWQNLDFSGSKLNSLRFYESEVSNCLFEKCELKDWRLWDTRIRDCSFRRANLRDSALGAAVGDAGLLGMGDRALLGKRNVYTRVDFTEADLRGTVYISAVFEQCMFRNTKLVKVDFGTSTFVDCQFEGELREVIFWRHGVGKESFPPGEMINVDFSSAKLRNVEFRGLCLEGVRLPSDSEQILVKNFSVVLDKLIDALERQGDRTAKILVAGFQVNRQWAHPGGPGVLNMRDLAEEVGEDAEERVVELLRRFGVEKQ